MYKLVFIDQLIQKIKSLIKLNKKVYIRRLN
ncbi:hypothetical protein U750_11190 [Streptococcus pseudopneumoniae G42]|nr:hypothetical protein U750_11190 [Streptococcus pseudopneumoniae G42]